MTEIHIAVAIARGGVIGRTTKPCPRGSYPGDTACAHCDGTGRVPANDMPWPDYPEDMKHFRDLTMRHVVIMGRRTKESIPEKFFPLKERFNIVISRSAKEGPMRGGAKFVRSLKSAIRIARRACADPDFNRKIFVIGGAQLYAAALPLATHLDLTLIDRDYAGDVRFPSDAAFHKVGLDPTYTGVEAADGSWIFECVERRQGTTPELTFTRWVRK